MNSSYSIPDQIPPVLGLLKSYKYDHEGRLDPNPFFWNIHIVTRSDSRPYTQLHIQTHPFAQLHTHTATT